MRMLKTIAVNVMYGLQGVSLGTIYKVLDFQSLNIFGAI